jgi:hypothetical protein
MRPLRVNVEGWYATTQEPIMLFLAGDDMDLETWLTALEDWARGAMKGAKLYRERLEDVEGIIEVRHNRKSNLITSAYMIHRDDFDDLLHGKPVDAGILINQCGLILPPTLSVFAYPEDRSSIGRFRARILEEAPIFFENLRSLAKVYSELTSDNPKFKLADPRGPQLRQMHAAVTAYLLNLDWKHHIEAAYRIKFHLPNDWLDVVSNRLQLAALNKGGE